MRKTHCHIPIKDGSQWGDRGKRSSLIGEAMGVVLRFEKLMFLDNEAIGKSGDITNGGLWKQFLKGNGIGTLVEDNYVLMMNEEDTCCGEIPGFDVSEGVVEKLILLGRLSIKWRDLEDERDSRRKGAADGGNPRRRLLIFRSIC
jgi:hypothetical protein